jgi:hypothetical protein
MRVLLPAAGRPVRRNTSPAGMTGAPAVPGWPGRGHPELIPQFAGSGIR